MKVIIAAGGTGGHINPAISIANKIKIENPKAQILFIGTEKGLEKDLVPRAGYILQLIRVEGFSRKISLNNIRKIFKVFLGSKDSKKIIKDFEPDIVIGTGGYVCGPVLMQATKNHIPTVLHESNALPGITTKLLASKVDKVLVGFDETKEFLKKAKNIVTTGNPVRIKKKKLSPDEKEKILLDFGLKNSKPIILVFGGSQGARGINNAFVGILKRKLNTKYQIIFATGQKNYEPIKEELNKKNIDIENLDGVKVLPYIYNMEEVMNIADLLVCRGGAMTLSEIMIMGKPSILIPLPTAAENHQEYNARVLEKMGAAQVILEKDLNADSLNQKIIEIVQDRERIIKMCNQAKKLEIKNVEDKIYIEIMGLIK